MTRKVPVPRYTPKAGYRSTTEAVLVLSGRGLKPPEVAAIVQTTVETVRGIIQRDRKARRDKLAKKLSDGQQRALKQAYVEYLHQVAAKMDSDIDTLHKLFRFCHVNNYQITAQKAKEPALPPEQKGGGIEPGERADPAVTPEPEPMPRTAATPLRVGSATRKDAVASAQAPEPIPAFLPKREPEPPVIVVKTKNTTTYDELTGASQVTLRATNGEWLNMNGSGPTRIKAYRYLGTPAQAKKMRLASKFATGMRIESASPSKGDRKWQS